MSAGDRHAAEPSDRPEWGQAWLVSLSAAGVIERVTADRARAAVRRGAVALTEIEPATVRATVAGNGTERVVRIGIARFSDQQWDALHEVVSSSARWVAALVAGELPFGLEGAARRAGASVFPGGGEVSVECSCDATTGRCGHAAAAVVALAELLDADPLLVLTLRGRGRSGLLDGGAPGDAAGGGAIGAPPTPVTGGRPSDPTMPGGRAWRRTPGALPAEAALRRTPGAPLAPATPVPGDLGFGNAGLAALVADAAVRAVAAATCAAQGDAAGVTDSLGLDAPREVDAVRRAVGRPNRPGAGAAWLARVLGRPELEAEALVRAWSVGGTPAVDVLLAPRRLADAELAAVERAFGSARGRSTGAAVPGGRQVRRAADGTWVSLVADDVLGWSVEDVAPSAASLAERVAEPPVL